MPPSLPNTPEDCRIYAIGDIHGCADLLEELLDLIGEDSQRSDPWFDQRERQYLIFLGDYIDRGPDSRGVVDILLDRLPGGFEPIFLKGNHEEYLVDMLADHKGLSDNGDDSESIEKLDHWLRYGGGVTLASYGVEVDEADKVDGFYRGERIEFYRRQLRQLMPARHVHFYRDLRRSFELGDYFFVHAGVRPEVPLAAQSTRDLLWIRGPFLTYEGPFEKFIIHGHTPHRVPVRKPNRIGIDTYACNTGILTAVVLEGDRQRFISTGNRF